MKLHELSVRRPVTSVMAVLVFVTLGLFSLTRLPIEMTPDISMEILSVITTYPNVAPSEIENIITDPIESAVSAVSGVDKIYSTSSESTSMVMVQFTSGTDIDEAAQSMKDKISFLNLPDDCNDPQVMKFDASMMPIAQLSFVRDGYSLEDTQKFLEDNVQNQLESIDGVASVTIQGATEREIHVEVDTNKMFGYNISMAQIVSAIASENNNMPGGKITSSGKDVSVRSIGKFSNLKEISSIPITTPSGQIIYLDDVAQVKDSSSDVTSIARLNGKDALSISIQKESGANTVDVVNRIKNVIENVKKQYDGCDYDFTFEQASYIENSIKSVRNSAFLGCILAILILFMFLSSIKSSLIIGITMPVSILITFVAMYFRGMSVNIVSLGGLTLGVGMLVDNAIVVLENIFRHRKDLGEDKITSAINGSREVIGAVVASVLTTCIVYVPMLFIDGMMVEMFKELAFVIIFSQCASLITTFMLIPMLSSKIENIDVVSNFTKKILHPFTYGLKKLTEGYAKLLRTVLSKRKLVLLIAVVLFVGSIAALGSLGMELMPSSDEGQISVSAELPLGSKIETADKLSQKMENLVSENRNVETVFSSMSAGGGSMMSSSGTSVSLYITLADKRKDSTDEVVEQLRKSFSDITGADISVEASSTMGTSMGTSSGVSFTLLGDDIDTLSEYADKAEKILKNIKGTREVTTSVSKTKTEARIYLDREKTAHYGLNTQAASALINAAVSGTTASTYTENGSEYDIKVKLPQAYTDSYEALKNIKLKAGTGQWITINDIGKISLEEGYNSISHQNKKRVITVSAQIYGTDIGTVTKAFNKEFSKINPPEGCSMQSGGTYETMQETVSSILLAIIVGILLMYMIMAAQFESYRQPLIIMGSLPMAIIGVALALRIYGKPVNMIALIGVLMLMGMIVNNAIVLIDFINESRRSEPDGDRTEIVIKSGITRLRPVLMTTLTSILGFMPMVFSMAEGSEMMRPLAIVLLGGLAVGTVLTLVFVPVVYTFFDDIGKKRKARKEKRRLKRLNKANA